MNNTTSLKWRLPLSYGAIALLTTLSLGVVLLFALNRYYIVQERRYLLSNAQAVSGIVASAETAVITSSLLQPQIEALSSLIQAQIQIYDSSGVLLADSGLPQQNEASTTLSLRVESGELAQEFSQTTAVDGNGQAVQSSTALDDGTTRVETTTSIEQDGLGLFTTPLGILETPFSFGLGATDPNLRSNQVVRYPIAQELRAPIGTVQLSQGPAFGRPILVSVAWGVGLAGAVAVLLATTVGWLVSRRLTRPLVQLADVAQQMAQGELAARATVQRNDEIGELGQSFNEMAEQLVGLIETLRHFVADAAHELRTPLTALRTNLELAMRQPENGRFLQNAHVQLQRVQSLTDDLLALSQLENVASQMEKRPFDLAALVQSHAERYAAQAEQAELTFAIDGLAEPLWVNGSETHLRRAIDNLLDNSFKFSTAGGVVRAALVREGETAVFAITDSGIGIPEPTERIFNRFYRAPNANEFAGSGLGLAIVKTIIDAHGGTIYAENHTSGTRFTMRLPLER